MFETALQGIIRIFVCLIFISLFQFNSALASEDLKDSDNFSDDDISASSGNNTNSPHHFLTHELIQAGNSPYIFIPILQGNVAIITQIGNKNQAQIKQIGGGNDARIKQQGNQNEADIEQIGFANTIDQIQQGDFNSASGFQFGHHNSIEQIQLGDGFQSRITQVGRYKSIRIIQGY